MALAGAVTERIWPCVMLQWEWLGGLAPVRRVAIIGAGAWGTSLAVCLARAGLEVDLGCRTQEQAQTLQATRENHATCRASRCPTRSGCCAPPSCSPEGHDIVCLAVPAKALPAVLAAHGGRITSRVGRAGRLQGAGPAAGHASVGVCRRALQRPRGRRARRPRERRRDARARRLGGRGVDRPRLRPAAGGRARRGQARRHDHHRRHRRRARRAPPRTWRRWRRRPPPRRRAPTSPAPRPGRCSPRSMRWRAPAAAARRRSPGSPAPATWWPPSSPTAPATAARASCWPRACRRRRSVTRWVTGPRRSTRCRCWPPQPAQAQLESPALDGLAALVEGRIEPEQWAATVTEPSARSDPDLSAPRERR